MTTTQEEHQFKCFNCAFTMAVRLPECPECGLSTMIVDMKEWRRLGSHTLGMKPGRRKTYRKYPKRPIKLMEELGIKGY